MKELVIKQPTKSIVRMIQKMVERNDKKDFSDAIEFVEEKIRNIDDKLYYEIIQKGTYTACILIIDNEIVGLGMTKRNRNDEYNTIVAVDVSVHKAIKDYLFGIKPEYLHVKG